MIEGEVNNILGQIVDFGMQLEIDGKNINAYLVYGDQRWRLRDVQWYGEVLLVV